MKMIISSSLLAAACAIPSASAALRGTDAAATTTSAIVNTVTTNNNNDDASSPSSPHRKLPYDSSGAWYWEYEGYTYTTGGTYETRYCYYAESNNFIGPLYDSMLECCDTNFGDQKSGACISKLPDNLQPSAQPSIDMLGLPGQYVAVHANGYEDGYCSNLKADLVNVPVNQIYDTEYECCSEVFPDQAFCLSQIHPNDPNYNQPSGRPSLGAAEGYGLPNQFVAVFANGVEEGYCSNLKADVIGTPENQIYESELECCTENFADQETGTCISQLDGDRQPSGQPSLSELGLPDQFVAVFTNGYEGGYCSNLKADVIGTPEAQIYDSEFECCTENFADQETGTCISQLDGDRQPSGQPSLSELGLPNQFVAVRANGYDEGYCSNLKEFVIGTPEAQIYDSEFECCTEEFADQTTGTCISKLDGDRQPSGQPSLSELGLPNQFVAVFTNGYEGGYCSNLKEFVIGTPEAQIYDSEFECCTENFADQTTGTCISKLDGDRQPSGQPSLSELGLPNQFVAVRANGYDEGYCSNLKEFVIGTPEAQIYDSEFECCTENFADQTTGTCISQLDGDRQPSGQPSLGTAAGLGLPNQFVAVFANGYEGGYCSNLKADVIGTPEAQIYDSELDCCTENFADQTTGTCISQLDGDRQPSGQPSFDNNGEGGLDVWVPVWTNSYNEGYCSNKKEDVFNAWGDPFDDAFECCDFWFGLQDDQKFCLSKVPDFIQPSGQPSLGTAAGLGLPEQFVAIYTNGYEDGYCSNLKADVIGTPEAQIYDSELDCCTRVFGDQASGTCISQLDGDRQPSGQPSLSLAEGLGLPDQFVAVFANGYEDGYCSNLKEFVIGTPDAQIYESEFECCTDNFADQTTGTCISNLAINLQPSGAPTFDNDGVGGLDLWVPVWPNTNSYESGYCSNKKEFVYKAYTQPIDSHIECCINWFSMQISGFCISEVEGALQPSSSPSITGGGRPNAKFFPRFPGVGNPPATENYCDNDHRVLPQWQLENYDSMGFDTQEECCESWFPELRTACTRRQPTFGTLPPAPTDCGFYPKHGQSWDTGTCVNDCDNPPEYENLSNLIFSDDQAGGIECCNTWFENNGLTTQQIGSGRLSYCLQQMVDANPTFTLSAPPTRAPVS